VAAFKKDEACPKDTNRIFAGDGSTRRIDIGSVTGSRAQKEPTEER